MCQMAYFGLLNTITQVDPSMPLVQYSFHVVSYIILESIYNIRSLELPRLRRRLRRRLTMDQAFQLLPKDLALQLIRQKKEE